MASRPAVLGPMDRARGMTGSGGASGGPGTASTRGGPLTPPPQDGMPPGPPAGERPVGPAGLPGERQGLASPIPANERPAPAPGIAAPRPVNLNGEAAQAPRLVGGVDRDWVITVECNGTGVSIPSRKQAFDWLALSKPDLPLQRFVLDMVRVQRDRQPDVRPSLNYVIMVDGLRAYYQAARQLEALGLPVTVEERKPAPPAAPGPR